MSTWLSEKEFRQSGAESAGVTINVAFLQEIKEEFDFRSHLNHVYHRLKPQDIRDRVSIRDAADLLLALRDELETYFALEEFYGYFAQAAVDNPRVSKEATELRSGHENLYLQLNKAVEWSQQLVYGESGPELTLCDVVDEFEQFCVKLAHHEQDEMDLMMRLCNEDFGVGD